MESWVAKKRFPAQLIAVCGLVTDSKGKILLLHSKRGWEFPGGVVEFGESLLDALRREIREETGYTAEPTTMIGIFQNLYQKDGYGPLEGEILPPICNIAFLCTLSGGEASTSDESDMIRWVTKEEAREMVTYPTYDYRLEAMLSYHGEQFFSAYQFKGKPNEKIDYMEQRLKTKG